MESLEKSGCHLLSFFPLYLMMLFKSQLLNKLFHTKYNNHMTKQIEGHDTSGSSD